MVKKKHRLRINKNSSKNSEPGKQSISHKKDIVAPADTFLTTISSEKRTIKTFVGKIFKSKTAKISGGIVAAAATVFTLVSGWSAVMHMFMTNEQIQEEENWVKGLLLPEDIDYTKPIKFVIGSDVASFDIPAMKEGSGVNFNSVLQISCGLPWDMKAPRPADDGVDYNPVKSLSFKIENNRLFASDTIKYIANEEIVGILNFNKWSLYKPNFIHYHEEDKSLEVIDKQGHVAFSMEFQDGNTVTVRGYFINRYYIGVVGERNSSHCLIKDQDKAEALGLISLIPPRHEY